MDPSRTISTAPLEYPAMDYALLREAGIRRLERLVTQQWTDFNAHDPGITILEQLCYALTDLSYRISYDLKDLLAGGEAEPYRSLYSPAEILTTNPVTLTDLRKIVIDVDGVKNAWVEAVEDMQPALFYDPSDQSLYLEAEPHRAAVPLRGVYRVTIEADGSRTDLDVSRAVRQRLYACRNLGADFEASVILHKQPITVSAKIEAGAVEDADRLLAAVYQALDRFISPGIRFYTLAELLADGRRIDEIMDGPALSCGFIDTAELERFERKKGLRASDLIHEIMTVPGVSAVNDLSLSDGSTIESWYLNLSHASSRSSTPALDIDASLFPRPTNQLAPNAGPVSVNAEPTIQLMRNGAPISVNAGRVKRIFEALRQADRRAPLAEAQRDIWLPVGRDRDIGRYHSIQHQFPEVYGIGELGLPDSASAERQAQARQLKAYLLFFDQLLANSFAQLAHAKELFSFDSSQRRTYFSQLIDDPRLGLDEVWVHDAATRAARLQSITEASSGESDAERKNRFLNHLLARFAEEFTDYSLHASARAAREDVLDAKSAFLRDYRQLGSARSRAFDYTQPSWGTENVSGLEQRISRKLGLATYRRRDLADLSADDPGGFHMLEPILLRPSQADLDQWAQAPEAVGWQAAVLLALPQASTQPQRADPFSLRLCFVFPSWISRLNDLNPNFVARLVREETPAHLDVQVQWLDREQMRAFETAYKAWLRSVQLQGDAPDSTQASGMAAPADLGQLTSGQDRGARDRLIDLLRIGMPYPLRDLKLSYVEMVALDQPTEIHILDTQLGVRYQLCDEDGIPIVDKQDQRVEATGAVDQADDRAILQTPAIVKDITFTILATREADAYGAPLVVPLETYLTTIVSIKAGINTALPVELRPTEGQIATDRQIIIEYGAVIRVAVGASQEGISYTLVRAGEDRPLAEPRQGDRAEIVLEILPSNQLREDADIQVKAYRTLDPNTSARLAVALSVLVRPDRTAAVSIDPAAPPIVDYGATMTLSLAAAQASADYELYQRRLAPAEYVSAETPGRLPIEGTNVFIAAPPITNWDDPTGLARVGAFQKRGKKLSITTDALTEDTLLLVLAIKTTNRQRLQLDQAVIVLVRPDPVPAVRATRKTVPANSEGAITVSRTQQGVRYELRPNGSNTTITAPGYDYRDRGVGTARLEVDFVVERPADPTAYQTLVLPTGKVSAATTYKVLATKILTGLSVELSGKATIAIKQADSDT